MTVHLTRSPLWLAVALLAAAGPAAAEAPPMSTNGSFCSATADNLLNACRHGTADAQWRARASCINLSGTLERHRCLATAERQSRASGALCREQRLARGALCQALGEGRYEPSFAPADFQTDFVNPVHPQPYFPLSPGSRWRFEGGGETIAVTVLARTKLIDGVTCVVVNDRVESEGYVVENTDDWFALRNDGAVFYCGESVRDYEVFEGDRPVQPELTSRHGSFKAGRDGDVPGLQFSSAPVAGMGYRQEFSPNNAEDAARILSAGYAYGSDPDLDRFVPAALANWACAAADCIVIAEFSPLEPAVPTRKYYARGIGLFLDVNPANGDAAHLVECNVDPRCTALPAGAGR